MISPLVQCNYPGCQEHIEFKEGMITWNCGGHAYLQPENAVVGAAAFPVGEAGATGMPGVPGPSGTPSHHEGCSRRIWLHHHSFLPSRHPSRLMAPKCDCGVES